MYQLFNNTWLRLFWLLSVIGLGMQDGIVLLKICGEKPCERYQYCSDNICHECSNPCSPPINKTVGHNFDAKVCEEHCQDYIHDILIHYVTYAESKGMQNEVRDTIDGLRTMVVLSLTLTLLVGVAMLTCLGFALLKYRRKKQARAQKKDIIEKKISTVSGNVNNNGLRIDMPTTCAPSVATTTTPISTRHPSEDTTLEYAYDNPGMTPSPVLAENRGETNF